MVPAGFSKVEREYRRWRLPDGAQIWPSWERKTKKKTKGNKWCLLALVRP